MGDGARLTLSFREEVERDLGTRPLPHAPAGVVEDVEVGCGVGDGAGEDGSVGGADGDCGGVEAEDDEGGLSLPRSS